MTWKETLVSLYLHISDNENIKNYLMSMRQSNNNVPDFTDEEVMTLYIFGIHQNYSKVKHIYDYTQNHLLDWFPKLPSYQAFVNRLNKLGGAFSLLVASNISEGISGLSFICESAIDSMPIIVAGNKRSSFAKNLPL